MDINQLHYFSALYKYRKLGLAAKSIPITHQGLSKSIASLEEELGESLFEIGDDSERIPTPYADAVFNFVELVDGGIDELLRDFERIRALENNRLNLVAAVGVLDCLGTTFLRRFEKKHPATTLTVEELPDWKCEESLLAGSFDIGFTVFPFNEELENLPLYRSERMVWVSVDDPLASRDEVELCDLEGYHVGCVGRTFKNYTQLLEAAITANVSFASIDTSTQMFFLNDYAKETGHASFTAPSVVNSFKERTETVAVPIKGFPWGFALSWRKNIELSELERNFIEFCNQYQMHSK